MDYRILVRRAAVGCAVAAAAFLFSATGDVYGQGRGGGRGGGGQNTAKTAAPIDITGYWVSIVTEDWRFRMVTPPKNDFDSVPINAAGRQSAGAWDPARDEAAGEQCRSYGAAAIMRVPGRINIAWQDDNTLKIDTDAGTQTRLFRFGEAPVPIGDRGWQGHSVARWRSSPGGREGRPAGASTPGGTLVVTTTYMRPGYLRKNGVPYGANAVLTEYYSTFKEPNGDQWLVVTALVEDSQYLTQPFITSSHFKKEADSKGWNPTPCSSR